MRAANPYLVIILYSQAQGVPLSEAVEKCYDPVVDFAAHVQLFPRESANGENDVGQPYELRRATRIFQSTASNCSPYNYKLPLLLHCSEGLGRPSLLHAKVSNFLQQW